MFISLYSVLWPIYALCIFAVGAFICLLVVTQIRKRMRSGLVVGFFHPYCNAGGGGERVLWCAVKAVQQKYPYAQCVVYTGDTDVTGPEIKLKAESTFNIILPNFVRFQHLITRFLVEAKFYPYFTLLGQSFGSMVLGLEAAILLPPDIYIDTMGYAFTLPIFKYVCGSQTACYVHYPTISSDMLNVVECRNNSFNNRKMIANSPLLTSWKLMYYKMFAYMYGLAGRSSSVVMVNSSWTQDHIDQLWSMKGKSWKVFPPCDVAGLLTIPLERPDKTKIIISIAQFRPEKDHTLQVMSFHRFLSNIDFEDQSDYKLVLAGGCRNMGDVARVKDLKQLIKKLKLDKNVEIQTNITFEKLKKLLGRAHVGLHTMKNEHFGIGIVEFQAAGVTVVAHNSGGPKMDIVQEVDGELSGFLADDEESYAEALDQIFLQLDEEELFKMQTNARKSCQRFSERGFAQHFQLAIAPVFDRLRSDK